ncbi:MAG: MraZ family transcriptional regulator [Fibrobacter sp.]|jgi:MraZ protein|nr:MraZ family transcriptional regulator [Fibrobacter sp.]
MNLGFFIGQAKTAIDEKGRTSFPKEFRRQLSISEEEGLVLSIGPERTLILYELPEFQKFMTDLNARPKNRKTEALRSTIQGHTSFVSLDGQNRVLLPKKFLDYAQIESEVLFIPHVGKSLKLWNPSIYESLYGFAKPEDFENFDDEFFSDIWMGDSNEKG